MKFTLFLISFFIGLSLFAQNKTNNNITVGFYNVENLFDTLNTPNKNDSEFLPSADRAWNSKRYSAKISHINEVYDSINRPSIWGICEIENKAVVEDIINNGTMKGQFDIVHYESLDQRGIDNALIYDSTLFDLIDSGIIRFDMPEPSSPSRDIVWAKLALKQDTIFVLVNHWPSRRGGQLKSEPKRLIAAMAARNFVDSLLSINKNYNILFMGDLNDHPEDRGPQMIEKLLCPMITHRSGELGGSNCYRGEWNVLDHIYVSKSFLKPGGIRVNKKSGIIHSPAFLKTTYKGNIVPNRTYGGRKYLGGYSDHFPVTIQIKIK
ncbi:MAG: endonuclease [Crocinitomicaceae bacterium]|nr:endonuclease [Crocinitomicaceae bacterium]